MPTLAATATSHTPTAALLVLVLLVVTAGYGLSCWLWPFTACRRCYGTGRLRSPIGRVFRHCPRCDGTGQRLRAGRHLVNTARRNDPHR